MFNFIIYIYMNLFFIIDALWKPMNEVDVKNKYSCVLSSGILEHD